MASVPSASSSRTLAASSRSRSPTRLNQPPCLKPSSPVGSWTTPSSETFSLMMIFPISVLLWLALSATAAAGGVACESPCALAHLAPVLITTSPPAARALVRRRRAQCRRQGDAEDARQLGEAPADDHDRSPGSVVVRVLLALPCNGPHSAASQSTAH